MFTLLVLNAYRIGFNVDVIASTISGIHDQFFDGTNNGAGLF